MNERQTDTRQADIHGLREQAADATEEQIIAEIELTRAEMSGTIDEIGYRLSPQVIAGQAREQIREATVGRVERIAHDAGDTAQQTGSTIIETIRQNPVPTALAALGIGWLALRLRDHGANGDRRGDGRRGHGRRRTDRDWYAYDTGFGRGRYGVREAYTPMAAGDEGNSVLSGQARGQGEREGVGEQADRMGEQARRMGDEARQAADDITAQARQATDDLSQQAQATWDDVQWRAQDQAATLQRRFDRTLDENPLALGALAVGMGAAVALAIPETERERELMGEQRDRLLSDVESEASKALGEVEQSARETGEKVRQESRSEMESQSAGKSRSGQ